MTRGFKQIKSLDLPAVELEIRDWWQRHHVFKETIAARDGAPSFCFYEGPPTANGRPGIHHVLGRTVKDIFCRFKTQQGFHVQRKGGWDTHGLPVEIEIEKELGLKSRADVEEYGIAKYNAACRSSVLRYKKDWDELTERIGYWVDLDKPYITFDNDYIESVWWLIKQLHTKGFLYKGHKIQWYSPGSGTVLSSHEVSLGYKETQDPSVYVRFPIAEEENTYFLAWTTTPWTLPSNVALAVGPQIEYVKVRRPTDRGEEYLILAASRLAVLGDDCEVVSTLTAGDLIGQRYQPLFEPDVSSDLSACYQIVSAEFVSTDDGTGIVHIAPAFGADDYQVARDNHIPMINLVESNGRFGDSVPELKGLWFKDADKIVSRNLRERGLMFRHDTSVHNYPFDWRKGTPLMNYPVESWFVETTAVKQRLIELNSEINWYPESIGDGRFGNWLENNVDWALSRKRFWGTPLPIWQSDKDGSDYYEVIGSVAELAEKLGRDVSGDEAFDLHRPYVDELTWQAPDGGTMRRVADVIDVWFDSGAMPFAQWHYPFENKDVFEQNFPADFICEGLDQTRGWFYTLHAIATTVMDSKAFNNVVVNGLILDEAGEKMSKSKGNTVDPFSTVSTHGADVVRWYLIANSPPWDNMRFAERGLVDTRRRFFATLENVYSFFASYANIDGFVNDESPVPISQRSELDQWIMSKAHSLVNSTTEAFDNYDATSAAREIESFVDALSNWYIRRSRRRFWRESKEADSSKSATDADSVDKLAAYQTTHDCLTIVAQVMAPIAPFFSEWLFQNLNQDGEFEQNERALNSVHASAYPTCDRQVIDEELEKRMQLARTVVGLSLLLRNQHRINVRQPLARVLVVINDSVTEAQLAKVKDVVLDEINVDQIEYIEDSSTVVTRSVKPDFKKLGPRLGKKMGKVAAKLKGLDEKEVAAFSSAGFCEIDVDGDSVRVDLDEVELISEEVGDWVVAQEGHVTVALDTTLDSALVERGRARELVNRIQNFRKASDLNLTDRIRIEYYCDDELAEAIGTHEHWIMSEILALGLARVDESPGGTWQDEFTIGESAISIGMTVDTGRAN